MGSPGNTPAFPSGLDGWGQLAGVIDCGMNDHSPPCKKNRQGFAAFLIMENRR